MSILEKIYDHSPIFFQNIMCSVAGYVRNRTRYGEAYWKHRQFLDEFDKLSLSDQFEYQRQEMVKLIHYAYEHSKFYHNLYKDVNINEINTIDDLKKLPIVDKEMLRDNIKDVITINPKNGVESHTGGTTGKSLVVIQRLQDSMAHQAVLDHFKHRVGFEHRKMKRATFNGKHIVPPNQTSNVYWRYNAACKQMIYSSFNLIEENLSYYVESLNKFKPDAIDGFFTAMCDVAGYIKRNNIQLTFKPVAIFPTSETLTIEGRELLEEVFGCKVYNQYASSEGAPFICECKNQVLHIELSTGIFEHFEDGNDEVLVTSFDTYGTPLIRYRIGDQVKFDNHSNCNCGLHSPTVLEILGRRLDFLYTPTGAKINAGCVSNLLKNVPNGVKCAQFIQENMNSITVKMEVDHEVFNDKHIQMIEDEIHHTFGMDMKSDLQIVDHIEREKSGKRRFIVNRVSK